MGVPAFFHNVCVSCGLKAGAVHSLVHIFFVRVQLGGGLWSHRKLRVRVFLLVRLQLGGGLWSHEKLRVRDEIERIRNRAYALDPVCGISCSGSSGWEAFALGTVTGKLVWQE